jgi:hypothetical protein
MLLTDAEKAGVARGKWLQEESSEYFKLQAIKQRAIELFNGGLLLWDCWGVIYEKPHDWSDACQWKDGEILTWAGIYYFLHSRFSGFATDLLRVDARSKEQHCWVWEADSRCQVGYWAASERIEPAA